jgi:uncharacterized membrane protein
VTFDRDRDPLEFGRLVNLSDGMFAIAMTILVLSLVVPVGLAGEEFVRELAAVVARIPIMALSLAIVFSAWLAHHRLFSTLQAADGGLIVLNVVFLGLVALTPLPHQVLGDYPAEPLSYVFYASVLGGVNVAFVTMDHWVYRRRLLRVDRTVAEHRRELASGLIVIGAFALSIPLAFVLVGLTPLIWLAALPLQRLAESRLARSTPRTTTD